MPEVNLIDKSGDIKVSHPPRQALISVAIMMSVLSRTVMPDKMTEIVSVSVVMSAFVFQRGGKSSRPSTSSFWGSSRPLPSSLSSSTTTSDRRLSEANPAALCT